MDMSEATQKTNRAITMTAPIPPASQPYDSGTVKSWVVVYLFFESGVSFMAVV